MTIVIETTCRQCGRTFTPSSQDIRRGIWRICPPCRAGPGAREAERHDHDIHVRAR